jgi:hypothetical protein
MENDRFFVVDIRRREAARDCLDTKMPITFKFCACPHLLAATLSEN